MTRRRLLAPSLLLISAIAFAPRAVTVTTAQGPSAAKAQAPEYGPPNGTLFIHGGGSLSIALIDKFIELGGGVDGRFVIVPTANGNFDATGVAHVYVESQVIGPWLNRGLKNVKMLHTHDPTIADTVEFAKVLSDATAVWFTGGRHHHIVDSYAGTLTYREFHKVLERGGIIGGSSAGATIQGDYLVRGDSRDSSIVMTDEPNHQKGFEFLRRSAIDQHIDARDRWDDLIPVIKRYPDLLGIGLSEETAIVVNGDQFEVMGKSKVAIHDNTRQYRRWEKPYYLLGAGDIYNMRTRKVVNVRHRPSTSEPTGTARPRSSAASAAPAVTPTVFMVADRALSSIQSDAAALADVRGWDQTVTALQRASRLRRRSLEADRAVRGRTFERFDQMHEGVRVFGADVTRQTNEFGQAVSVFGTIYEAITVDTAPDVTAARAALILAAAGHGVVGPASEQELVVLPLDDGARLTWTARVFANVDGHVERIFVDARSGAVVYSYDDTWTQGPSGRATGTGLAGDILTMPVSVSRSLLTGSVQAVDLERPGSNTTLDLKGDPVRATSLINFATSFSDSDIAGDRDNKDWSPVVLSAHTYAGYVYDYYLNNFGRHGLDDRNVRLRIIVNPVKPELQSSLGSQYPTFFNTASYRGNGVAIFGVGTANRRDRCAALDIVGHELTHGVTTYSSKLIYQNESGALNESFSDIMGVAMEFDNQPVGSGLARADWLLGEDALASGSIRNFITPTVNGHPDHYSIRLITTLDNDGGGVHTNSSISNHAFYLAIMGGTNRVSGLSVDGVGFSNRKQIEKVFYRAFTQILTASSNFSNARAACIQAARDLFGVNSAAERAVTQAWDAVGVF